MAFPIPSHLPRKSPRRDVATEILAKIDEANLSALTPSLAASWVAELDAAIESTQKRIHERIQNDLPTVERQLASSKSIQTRLETLRTNVHILDGAVTDAQTGLLPTLIQTLSSHSGLAKEFANASTIFSALSHLLQLKRRCSELEDLVTSGELCEAARIAELLDRELEHSPVALQRSSVLNHLKSRSRVIKDQAREQLGEAYARGIIVTSSEITVSPSVQVRQSSTVLQLPSILSSIDATSLSVHLDTLRRDLTNHFIQAVLKQPTSVTSSSTSDLPGNSQHKIALFHSPPNHSPLTHRLDSLSTVLSFLSTNLFPAIPDDRRTTFMRSLSKAITTSLLTDLLVPNLPITFDLLPPYLELVQQCIDFEDRFVANLLDPNPVERAIQTWAAGLRGHYERQRRSIILDLSRTMVVGHDDLNDTFKVEIDVPLNPGPSDVVVVQEDETSLRDTNVSANEVKEEVDAWGLDDEPEAKKAEDDGFDESGWGLDDDLPVEDEQIAEPVASASSDIAPRVVDGKPSPSQNHSNTLNDDAKPEDTEPDPSDAWGWNDEEDGSPPTDESAWDDPWTTDESASEPPAPSPPTIPSLALPSSPAPSPKVATRLEKFSKQKKNQRGGGGLASPAISSPLASSPLGITSLSSPAQPSSTPETAVPRTAKIQAATNKDSDKRPPHLVPLTVVPKETYTVSQKMKLIVKMVEETLHEGVAFSVASSQLPLLCKTETYSTSSRFLIQTAPEILDLFSALYPIVFQRQLADHSARAMQFSNDCLYLSREIDKLTAKHNEISEKLDECKHHLKVLGDSWFEDTIDKHRQAVDSILVSGADGFTQSTDQEKYDEYEGAITQVLSVVRRLSHDWKGILAKSKYYAAIGQVTDAALLRVLEDILALPDITEVESHRLSELCRILNALEGLFVEDQVEHPFTAAYVPSWLKFSYLSELLEASMADITYLFEEGALVDFDIDELVRLVRAIFADTPLRSATIAKLQAGHPTQ